MSATSMREVSSERHKNLYPRNTSGIYQHRRGTADFLYDRFDIRSPWNCVEGLLRLRVAIPSLSRSSKTKSGLMMGLTILSTRGISFLKEVPLERWTSVFDGIHFARLFLIVTFNSLVFDIIGSNIDICCACFMTII